MFLLNITDQLNKQRRENKKVPRGQIMVLVVFASLIGFYFYNHLMLSLKIPFWFSLISYVLVVGFLVFIVFRKKLFNENDMKRELNASKEDSLANYYYISDSITQTVKLDAERNLEVMEYSDGTQFIAFRFRYGACDNIRRANNRRFIGYMMHILTKLKIDVKAYVTREQYSTSIECDNFSRSMSGEKIDDKHKYERLINQNKAIVNHILKESELSTVQCITFILKFKSNFSVRRLRGVVLNIEKCIKDFETSIRYMELLNKDKFKSFIVDYFDIEVFDSTVSRTNIINKAIMESYANKIEVYSVQSSNGEIVKPKSRLNNEGDNMTFKFGIDLSDRNAKIVKPNRLPSDQFMEKLASRDFEVEF